MTSYGETSQRIPTSGPRDKFRTYLVVTNEFRTGVLKAFAVEVAKEGYVKIQVGMNTKERAPTLYNLYCSYMNIITPCTIIIITS